MNEILKEKKKLQLLSPILQTPEEEQPRALLFTHPYGCANN